MKSRAAMRARLVPLLLKNSLRRRNRVRPQNPARILIAQHLLLGDTIMLTPLLARLRERYASAEIVMLVPPAFAPLYVTQPYGVRAIPYDARDTRTLTAVQRYAPFDIAFLPADNRFSALARALEARWIVGFAGDKPAYKNWLLDEAVPFAQMPMSFADLTARLVDVVPPQAYRRSDWPPPPFTPFERPIGKYCVLHAGASNPLKQWPAPSWAALAAALAAQGYRIVWSGGVGEAGIVAEIDPDARYRSLVGRLDLAQLWHLIEHAQALISVDTGIAHLGRLTGTPTVTLFGPGSATVCGAGDFWRDAAYRAVYVPDVACRDQQIVFRRDIPGLRHCVRLFGECTDNICLQQVGVAQVRAAIDGLIQ